jgi:hypothetical protein
MAIPRPRPLAARAFHLDQTTDHAPARAGICDRGASSFSVSSASPAGAHQHEAQAHAATSGTSLAMSMVRGLRLIANAARAPTADVGILASLDYLEGPTFDAAACTR